MADQTEGGAATAVAPAETEQVTEAPETGAEEQQQVSTEPDSPTRRSVRQRASETDESVPAKQRYRQAFLDRMNDEGSQPRDEKGRFASQEGAEQPEEEEGTVGEALQSPEESEATEEVASSEEGVEPSAAEAAEEEGAAGDHAEAEESTEPPPSEGVVHVPLPEGHPLRDQGQESIPTTPEGERHVRALVNSHIRRKEVEEAQAEAQRKIDEVTEDNIRLRAELEASTALRTKLLQDPKIKQEYDSIRNYSPEAAERYLRGLEAEHQAETQSKVQEQVEEARRQRQTQRRQKTVQEFRADMKNHVRTAFPQVADVPQLDNVLERAFRAYGAELHDLERRGQPVQLDHKHFVQNHVVPHFMADQAIRERIRQRQKQEQQKKREQTERKAKAEAKAEAKEAEKERLRDAAERHKTKNPVAQVPSEVRTGQQSTSPEEDTDYRGVPASDIKEQRKQALGLRTRRSR